MEAVEKFDIGIDLDLGLDLEVEVELEGGLVVVDGKGSRVQSSN